MNLPTPDNASNCEDICIPLQESLFDVSGGSAPKADLTVGSEAVEEIPLPVTEFDCSAGLPGALARNGAVPPSSGATQGQPSQ